MSIEDHTIRAYFYARITQLNQLNSSLVKRRPAYPCYGRNYVKMPPIFIRLTREWTVLKDFVEGLACSRIAAYEHEADEEVKRTHVHFYIEDYPNTIEGFKKSLKKHLDTTTYDRSDWSFKSLNKDGSPVNSSSITYMSKGTLQPVFVKGFTQEQLNTFMEQWVERPQRSYQTKLAFVTRETPSEAKKRKNDLVAEMILLLNEMKPKDTGNLKWHSSRTTVEAIIRVLNNNHVIFGRYQVRDYYDTIHARTNTEGFVDALCSSMEFPNK